MTDPLYIPDRLPDGFVQTPPEGLTEQEAARRKPNCVRSDRGKPWWQIAAEHLFTLFNLLNIVLAACLALVGSWRNMLFMGVVISNTLIGAVQELRARRTIRKLTLLNAPVACVRRGGEERTCPPCELVQGDLVILHAGDQVVADAVIIGGAGAADESLLSGESDPVRKAAGDWLMSGSYVTEGTFTAQLVYVGDESYAARLTRSAREIRRPQSALMTDLNKLIRFVSVVLAPLGLLLFAKQYFVMHDPLAEAVPSTVAAMIGMIPEGLMLLTSVAMAVGVVKLGRHHTLVQELNGIETLARADVLCLDKTGTITTGRMKLASLEPVDAGNDEFRAALSRFLGAHTDRSGTLDALRQDIAPGKEAPVATLPFSSVRKCSAASFADGTTLILGAPSFVLPSDLMEGVAARATEAAEKGYRVLALAESSGCVTQDEAPVPHRLLGLCLLSDEVRPSAPETVAYFKAQGVTLKVISGDDPRTVRCVAGAAGITGEAVDASLLTDDQLRDCRDRVTIFGRVTPARKQLLVEALKARGHSVAMTGDGVNDIPALKVADCSIAMAGGSDAAKHAAQMTLLDADFANLPRVMAEGRRVIGNITRAASLFLVKTMYSMALAVLMLLLPASYPFQPIQLTLVSSLTIGLPGFILALEPHRGRVEGPFLQTVLMRAVPSSSAVTLCAAAAMLCRAFGWPEDVCSTLATLSAGAVGLMMLWQVSRPLTRLRLVVWIVMAGLMVACVLLAGPVFYLTPLTATQCVALCVLMAVAVGVQIGLVAVLKKRIDRKTS